MAEAINQQVAAAAAGQLFAFGGTHVGRVRRRNRARTDGRATSGLAPIWAGRRFVLINVPPRRVGVGPQGTVATVALWAMAGPSRAIWQQIKLSTSLPGGH